MTHYEEIHKDKIEFRLQQRYQSELAQLGDIGFHELHYTREVVFPFSALVMFYLYPIFRFKRELVHVEFPLRYVFFNPLLYNREYDSYAHIFGLGVKFATLFRDNTILITTNYQTKTLIKPDNKIYRYGDMKDMPVAQVWERHQAYMTDIETKGRETVSDLSLDNFETMMHRDETALLFKR